MAQFDIKIVNGLLVDGTGDAPYKGDLAIKDGKIAAIGKVAGDADKVIDASGQIVTPGFIDLHTHYDGQISWDSELRPAVNHGVTTAVLGNCGVGFAPCRPEDRNRLISLMEGVEDIPGVALSEGLTWDWETLPEYMDVIDAKPHSIDFACYVTHDPLRVYVMGDRAGHAHKATEQDIADMRRLTEEALQAGAIGFSTGRSDVHVSSDGEFTPSSEASTGELSGIAKALDSVSHGVLQAVSDFNIEQGPEHFDPEFDIVEDFAKIAGDRPTYISVMQRDLAPKQYLKIVERVEQANANGANIRMQVAPRAIGVMVGLQCTFHPFMGYPSFLDIAGKPLGEMVATMRDPGFKAKLLSEKSGKTAGDGSAIPPLVDLFLQNLELLSTKLFVLGDNPDYEQPIDNSLYVKARNAGVSPLEMVYDTMLEDDGKALIYFPIYNYTELSYNNVRKLMTHEFAVPGLSDGGAHVGTVCDASFPTYSLIHWTRDRAKDRLPLEWMVNFWTKRAADSIGFADRGVLAAGKKADINVIDYDNLRLKAPYMLKDLPAGGQRLMQEASGITASIVSGQIVVDHDQMTAARPGRLVRGGQTAA